MQEKEDTRDGERESKHGQQMAEKGEFGSEDKSMHFMIVSVIINEFYIFFQTNWRTAGFAITKVKWICV